MNRVTQLLVIIWSRSCLEFSKSLTLSQLLRLNHLTENSCPQTEWSTSYKGWHGITHVAATETATTGISLLGYSLRCWPPSLHPAVGKIRNGKLLLVLKSCCIYFAQTVSPTVHPRAPDNFTTKLSSPPLASLVHSHRIHRHSLSPPLTTHLKADLYIDRW